MTTSRFALTLLVSVLLLPACSVFDRPHIAGEVVEVSDDQVLVELDPAHPDIGDDARVLLGGLAPEARPSLAVRHRVSVWLSGNTQDSDPPGVEATRVKVE